MSSARCGSWTMRAASQGQTDTASGKSERMRRRHQPSRGLALGGRSRFSLLKDSPARTPPPTNRRRRVRDTYTICLPLVYQAPGTTSEPSWKVQTVCPLIRSPHGALLLVDLFPSAHGWRSRGDGQGSGSSPPPPHAYACRPGRAVISTASQRRPWTSSSICTCFPTRTPRSRSACSN